MKSKLFAIGFLLFAGFLLFSEEERDFKTQSIFGALWENDGFISISPKSDRFYTNGISLYYAATINPESSLAQFSNGMDSFLSMNHEVLNVPHVGTMITSVVSQDMYTPEDLTLTAANPNDRPYAGWTRFDFVLTKYYYASKSQSTYAFSLGNLGDAGAAATQKTIHVLADAQFPYGWDNHVANRMAWHVKMSKSYKWFTNDDNLKKWWFTLYRGWDVEFGNVYNRVSFDFTPKLGLFSSEPKLPGDPQRYPVTGDKIKVNTPFSFAFMGKVKLYFSTYNGTLDAQTGVDYKVEEFPVYMDLQAGMEMYLFDELLYVKVCPYNSRSIDYIINNSLFDDPGKIFYHNWGHLEVAFRF